jgi:SAM-dependent methyltransferase
MAPPERTRPDTGRFSHIIAWLGFVVAMVGLARSNADDRPPDAPFVPTPQPVVEKMLEMAGIKAGDVVFDLGCGDGRILVTAAKKYGVKAYGCDIDPERVKESLANAKKNEVLKLVTVEQKDMFEVDLSGASVLTLYVLPSMLEKLKPQMAKMKAGARIVSHDFRIDGVEYDKKVEMKIPGQREHAIYLYTLPLKKMTDK